MSLELLTRIAMLKANVCVRKDTLEINVINAQLVTSVSPTAMVSLIKIQKIIRSISWYNINFLIADCECNADGSVNNECNSDGECNCKEHVQGNKCDTVIPGWYKLVDPTGTIIISILVSK